MKDSFIFHFENIEDIEDMTLEEQGMIFQAMIRFAKDGTEPDFEDRALKAAWKPIRRRLKSDAAYYEAVCERNRENGAKGGRPSKRTEKPAEDIEESKNPENPAVFEENPENRTVILGNPKKPKKPDTDTDTDTDTDIDTDTDMDSDTDKDSDTDTQSVGARARAHRRKYGEYGWVQLTDDQYGKLCADLGEQEVKRCITRVDELAQSTKNKNKWRDWNLVVRRCSRENWGNRNKAGPTRGNVWEGIL